MKILAILLTVSSMQLAARGYSQGITLSFQNVPLEKVFTAIEQQSKFRFVYSQEDISLSKNVSIELRSATLEQVLKICFTNQPLRYSITDNYIIIKVVPLIPPTVTTAIEIKGRVTQENGEPIAGATVVVKGTSKKVITNERGEFVLTGVNPPVVLLVSRAEMETAELTVRQADAGVIILIQKINQLDESIVIGYGTTTRRFTTGSVGKITSAEIARQPVSNPLAALQGRVPGLVVTSTSGVPGSSFTVQIRGQNSLIPNGSIASGFDQPLFIIDGVPFAPQNSNVNQFTSVNSPGPTETWGNAFGGTSPFNNLNPADIESIEVLKDADATAIYGSRAANGVILITTKKASKGKTSFTLSFNKGISHATRTMEMMNTAEYLAMRKEAFANDGIIPSINPGNSYAPDLKIFDSTRQTDFQDLFTGNSFGYTDLHAGVTGGSAGTQFLLGAGLHRESFMYPGDFKNSRGNVHTHFNHLSPNKKFTAEFSSSYSYTENNSTGNESLLRYSMSLPPNYPALMDAAGNLQWNYKGVQLNENPFGYLRQRFIIKTYDFNSNLKLGYQLFKNLKLQVNFGYNTFRTIENSQLPKSSFNPATFDRSGSYFGTNNFETYIIEPRLDYKIVKGLHQFSVTAGTTYQQNSNYRTAVIAENYQDDALLGSIAAAGTKSISDEGSLYKYAGAYGRINYIYAKKYILNINGRRDGSSRFGPGHQFGNFASLGTGWIFSEELKNKKTSWLSYGKLRLSYGTTGNDAIGNYQFIPRWANGSYAYQGGPVYIPQNLFNPDFGWSLTKKFDAGIDLGFFQDKFLLNITWYRNRSGNQLLSQTISNQSGFQNVLGNFPALVQNTGLECSFQLVTSKRKKINWESSLNFSLQSNKLIAFPELASSSYASIYTIGESTRQLRKYTYLGINDTSGVYMFEDVNKDGVINTADRKVHGSLEPVFAGGMNHSFRYKNAGLDIFFEFRQQTGPTYLQQLYSYPAGSYNNLPASFTNRWRKKGDAASLGKLTTSASSEAGKANVLFRNSNAVYGDASYLRCKNISLYYNFPPTLVKKLKIDNCRLFFNAQNVFVITGFNGNDPETMSYYTIPPLKTFVTGLSITL